MPSSSLVAVGIAVFVVLGISRMLTKRAGGPKPSRETTPTPSPVPPAMRDYVALAADLGHRLALPTAILQPDPSLPPGEPTETRVGGVLMLGRGESWPRNDAGVPMQGLMQINVAQLPNPPAELQGVAFVAVFWDRSGIARDRHVGHVREYASLADLVPAVAPPEPKPLKDFPVRFLAIQERAPLSMLLAEVPDYREWADAEADQLWEALESLESADAELSYQCKVGGWPASVQDDIDRPVTLQVGYDDVARINLVDAGCLYLWRVQKDGEWVWESDLQFY